MSEARNRAPGMVMIVLGVAGVVAAFPLGLATLVVGSLLCDDPHADMRVCNTVAYGPPLVVVLVAVVLTVVGAAQLRR